MPEIVTYRNNVQAYLEALLAWRKAGQVVAGEMSDEQMDWYEEMCAAQYCLTDKDREVCQSIHDALYANDDPARQRSYIRGIEDAGDWVYFARMTVGDFDLVKIGVTIDIKKRLKSLQTGCPGELEVIGKMRGGLKMEQHLHRKFGHLRYNREWFRPGQDLLDFIKGLPEQELIAV
jgi:hypothetical protein